MSNSHFRIISILVPAFAMCVVVACSNILVQYPVNARVGPINLVDILTWGAFTYPFAFLVNDLTNRALGPVMARRVVFIGFLLAVAFSVYLATPRIAVASGSAFLAAQLLDVGIFNRMRDLSWWKAPAISSLIGSGVDTVLFFSLAFAAQFSVLGPNDPFAIEVAPLLGFMTTEMPRWMSWALGDFFVKLVIAAIALVPYRVVLLFIARP